MGDAVQSSSPFVVSVNDVPWRPLGVCSREHRITRSRIVVPTTVRFQIHAAKLPDFPGIIDAFAKSASLFFLAHFEPIFDQRDTGFDDISLPGRTYFEESLVFFVRAKPHHPLNAETVIPTPVENNDLAPCWEMFEISLKINLCTLPLGRSRKSNHPKNAGAHSLSDPFDDAAFASRVSAFKDHDNFRSRMLYPQLQFDQLCMELGDLLFVFFALELWL